MTIEQQIITLTSLPEDKRKMLPMLKSLLTPKPGWYFLIVDRYGNVLGHESETREKRSTKDKVNWVDVRGGFLAFFLFLIHCCIYLMLCNLSE